MIYQKEGVPGREALFFCGLVKNEGRSHRLLSIARRSAGERALAGLYAFLQPCHRLIQQGGHNAEDDDAHDHHIHFKEKRVRGDSGRYPCKKIRDSGSLQSAVPYAFFFIREFL